MAKKDPTRKTSRSPDKFEGLNVSIATMSLSPRSKNYSLKVLQRIFSNTASEEEEKKRGGKKSFYFGSIYDAFFHLIFGDPELAAEFMRLYATDFAEFYDFTKTKLLPNDIVSKTLSKRVADLIVQAPKKNDSQNGAVISVIVEHKAQSGNVENLHTAVQTVYYMTSTMLDQLVNKRNPKPLVFGLVVYTGPDKKLDSLSLETALPLGEEEKKLARYALRCELFFVNLTKLYAARRLVGSPMLLAALRALGSAGNGTLDKDFDYVVEPLKNVDWNEPKTIGLFQSLKFFLTMFLVNHSKELDEEKIEKAGMEAIPEKMRGHMKTYLDVIMEKRERQAREEGREQGLVKGRKEGKEEGRKEGRKEGKEEGRKEGRKEGREEGRKEADLERARKMVSQCLEQFGDRSQELRKQIEALDDVQLLDSIFAIALRTRSFNVLEKKIADLLTVESVH